MEESEDMHSLLLTDSSTLLVAGLQNHVLEIDLNTVQETQKVLGAAPQRGEVPWAGLQPCSAPLSCLLRSTRWRCPGSPS